ncbi:MotA/TolQ/ExbB proton channel family protein [Fulvivirgaceae bacterium PWU4]|uniref:MotA/TolQ/ExbB proton channel family protein n=1 Tax=Chryseosolibacter histidini TaxID=2782349 RepID=A0AAP2DSB0_9BACT|nr:MotA/TolQ/ExbB proton channel family protein [Chryseosolibacter histidini]MBT1700107.1 MotA/TolQ/ExbB proton channel family protein [Chryseosolibacter histidini]
MILLQISTDSTAIETAAQSISVLDLAMKGGVIMIPLALMWVIAVYIFVERLLTINRAAKIPDSFMNSVKDLVTRGDVNGARIVCSQNDTPTARIIEKGIMRIGKPIENIEKSMENIGRLELYKMEKNLVILTIIAGVAPMFGFLGTIAGMIQTFFNISITSDITLGTIAGGIYVKMITSATGLMIGIMAYIGYSYLNAQIDKVVNYMEAASAEFIDVLHAPVK